MRLKNEEIKALQRGFEESALCPSHYSVFLFGSRTDDNKKGGDIDLLLVVEDEAKLQLLTESQHVLQVAFKKYLDDQRLDLSIVGRNEFESKLKTDPFYLSISKSLIQLFNR